MNRGVNHVPGFICKPSTRTYTHTFNRRKTVKMKMFGKEGSKEVAGLENEVNAWLGQNPHIKVTNITQSASGGSLHDTKLYIVIWYEDA